MVANEPAPVPILICGPTAVGKTNVALELATRLEAEIISVDSMQVYRGMNIGTAKPTVEERQRISHHLVDILDLNETFDAAVFRQLASESTREIQSRGRLPLFCGGTGLYFKAYLHGLNEAPPSDPDLRAELKTTAIESLLAELASKDPETLARIDRQNPRRVIRAVEVIRLTGKPVSAQRSAWSETHHPARGVCIGLSRAPDDLRRRIDSRVEEMFAAGLVEETRRLLHAGLERNPTASQALGYRQVIDHLRGGLSLPETIDLVKTRTRQFAKKQMTWFRRQMNVHWIHLEAGVSDHEVQERILAAYKSGGSD
jgi:tRNA dimethylallyltransferase